MRVARVEEGIARLTDSLLLPYVPVRSNHIQLLPFLIRFLLTFVGLENEDSYWLRTLLVLFSMIYCSLMYSLAT